jgi:hypothetical protein
VRRLFTTGVIMQVRTAVLEATACKGISKFLVSPIRAGFLPFISRTIVYLKTKAALIYFKTSLM